MNKEPFVLKKASQPELEQAHKDWELENRILALEFGHIELAAENERLRFKIAELETAFALLGLEDKSVDLRQPTPVSDNGFDYIYNTAGNAGNTGDKISPLTSPLSSPKWVEKEGGYKIIQEDSEKLTNDDDDEDIIIE